MANLTQQVRTKLGVTQERMARLLGVSFVSVSRWENGHQGLSDEHGKILESLREAILARGAEIVESTLQRCDGDSVRILEELQKL